MSLHYLRYYLIFDAAVADRSLSTLFSFRVVEFASFEDMKTALTKLDNTELSGRKIRLREDRGSSRRRRLV